MRKGWKTRCITENAWGLKFTRWYILAPSGNVYHMFRGCYFNAIYVPTTLNAIVANDKNFLSDEELRRFNVSRGEGKIKIYNNALRFIYETEERGGFREQKVMNNCLMNKHEVKVLYGQAMTNITYASMP